MKIMVVDDSAFMRAMIKNILKDKHEVFEAGNADEALRVYKDSKPNLVFLDVVLPGKSGIDILKDIRIINPVAKIVMCTSVGGQQKIIDEAVQAGASDFIIKPFKPEDILKAVTNFEK
ncbi:response regulator [Candidatus Woesearchaeota archaeon]|nr:response regulator [Candidatus Woesearchaeota archaeon]